jgi:hypothetical protein
MKPIDYRNATWEHVQAHLSGLRQQVYTAFVHYGPGTTRELATRSGISILTLRPRTTELLQLGFVEMLGGTEDCREAVYIAVPVDMVKDRFEWIKAQPVQMDLPY